MKKNKKIETSLSALILLEIICFLDKNQYNSIAKGLNNSQNNYSPVFAKFL